MAAELAPDGLGNIGGDLHDRAIPHGSNANCPLEQVIRTCVKMGAHVSRRGLKSELNHMGDRRTHNFTTSCEEIHHWDGQRLWSGKIPHKRAHALSTLD